jgi:hypothetical protein
MGGGRGRRQLPREQGQGFDRAAERLNEPVSGLAADPVADPVAAVRSMPGESSREGLHVLARDLIEGEPSPDLLAAGHLPADHHLAADHLGAGHLPADHHLAADHLAADHLASESGENEATEEAGGQAQPESGSLLGRVVDVFVGARRLANWSLWLQLAAAAHLIGRWQSSPPIVEGAFDAPNPADLADRRSAGLAERLWRLVDELDIWGPVDTHDLAETFVASEIAAAAGLSHYNGGQVVDAARALFMSTRLPRTRALLRAGLLDWTKLCTILSATQLLDDEVCALVEAAVIADGDLAIAEPLDVLADPSRPGAPLPEVARLNNPTLRARLHEAIAAIDAEAAARRSAKARAERRVWGTPLPDGMGELSLLTGQEQIAAILTGLDEAAAAAKAAGDPRRMDQIRCDHAVHLLTDGSFGANAYPHTSTDEASDGNDGTHDAADGTGRPDGAGVFGDESSESGGGSGRSGAARSGSRPRRARRKGRRRRGLQVRLTVPLSTWLDLADDPAVLDGYGPIPAALARQIAGEAARDHPETTTWRCVVVADRHRTVLGVGDVIPTPRHDPTARQATFTRTAEPFCVFPGCRVQAWRCDIDHRIPYHPDSPGDVGPTCTCNLQTLCRRHHRLRTAGLITPRLADTDTAVNGSTTDGAGTVPGALADGCAPPGTVIWTTFTGRSYEHRPPAATPEPAPREMIAACAAIDARNRNHEAGTPMDEIYDENNALAHWDRSRQLQQEKAERAAAARRRPTRTWTTTIPDEPPF